jgi:glycosyltransferase involved in cell wall biosynthesis
MGIKKIKFIALSPTGSGLSGGDRIFIELARCWSIKNPLEIITTSEGLAMIKRQNLSGNKLKINVIARKIPSGFFSKYIYKILLGLKYGLSGYLKSAEDTLVYSASEFWMDTFPAILLKIRHPSIKWVATWYQTAPNPFKGYVEGGQREGKYRLSAFLYWFSQFPIKPLIKVFADYVLVNNDSEKKQFHNLDIKKRVIVVLGAVDLKKIGKWRKQNRNLPKVYDAVFQGRFHPQKGVVELIEIWQKVVAKRPEARLVMIGDGPLMAEVKLKIKKYGLGKNIKLLGYVFDGEEKYKTFSQSKLVAHPAFYDSGGMASAEAMAFGIPCVGFNLKSYISYYPKGMIKVEVGDLNAFAGAIIKLLRETHFRNRIGKEAEAIIRKEWDWGDRARQILYKIR